MKFLFFPATAGERVLKRLFWNFTLLLLGLLHDIAIASSATGLAFFLVAALYFATANAIPGKTPNLPLVAIPPPLDTI